MFHALTQCNGNFITFATSNAAGVWLLIAAKGHIKCLIPFHPGKLERILSAIFNGDHPPFGLPGSLCR
ncbi:hypothetical protein KCP74_13740 [Salmonella enterica subsp. enterica]|nr:hypothetical protein KCP74_13740 [Salmonella enterica subsp. enterica]